MVLNFKGRPVIDNWTVKHKLFTLCTDQVRSPYTEHAASGLPNPSHLGSIRVAELLALPTSDHGVAGSNPAVGEILPEPKRRFIAQSLSCSPFHRLEMTEILFRITAVEGT